MVDTVRTDVARANKDSGAVADDRVISVEGQTAGRVGDGAVERAAGVVDGTRAWGQVDGGGLPARGDWIRPEDQRTGHSTGGGGDGGTARSGGRRSRGGSDDGGAAGGREDGVYLGSAVDARQRNGAGTLRVGCAVSEPAAGGNDRELPRDQSVVASIFGRAGGGGDGDGGRGGGRWSDRNGGTGGDP